MKHIFLAIVSVLSFHVLADVVIPVPSDIGSELGNLQINGVPGAGQNDEVRVLVCTMDGQGNPVKFGCDISQFQTYKLNQPIALPSGLVIVTYSSDFYFASVTPGGTTTINLQKISVPATRSANFTVFTDLTNPDMQDKMIYQYWLVNNGEWLKTICPNKNKKAHAVCDAFASNDYHRLRDVFISFAADGSYSRFDQDKMMLVTQGRANVVDPKAGEFVSVFPGVFGIEFEDPVTKKKQSQFGIVVR